MYHCCVSRLFMCRTYAKNKYTDVTDKRIHAHKQRLTVIWLQFVWLRIRIFCLHIVSTDCCATILCCAVICCFCFPAEAFPMFSAESFPIAKNPANLVFRWIRAAINRSRQIISKTMQYSNASDKRIVLISNNCPSTRRCPYRKTRGPYHSNEVSNLTFSIYYLYEMIWLAIALPTLISSTHNFRSYRKYSYIFLETKCSNRKVYWSEHHE